MTLKVKHNLHGAEWDVLLPSILENMDDVTEIETNGTTSLFIKQHGKRKELENVFESPEDYAIKTLDMVDMVTDDMEKALNPHKRFLAEGRYRLSDGGSARVHIVLPPACDYPQVTIAKKSLSLATLESIKERGSFNSQIFDFLKASVDCNLTTIFSGGTGAGKTTMLEAMTRYIPMDTRLGVVEDSPELALIQPNTTYLHSTLWTPGKDPNEVASLAWCVQQINRQRTDRLIIGESRGGEFAQFIIGANSGMDGSMSTIHANTPILALQKMTQFVIIGTPQPVRTANESIANTIDLIVQLGFNSKGENRLLGISEVSRTLNNGDSAAIATLPLFTYKDEDDSWDYVGYCSEDLQKKLRANGYDHTTFKPKTTLGSAGLSNKLARRG